MRSPIFDRLLSVIHMCSGSHMLFKLSEQTNVQHLFQTRVKKKDYLKLNLTQMFNDRTMLTIFNFATWNSKFPCMLFHFHCQNKKKIPLHFLFSSSCHLHCFQKICLCFHVVSPISYFFYLLWAKESFLFFLQVLITFVCCNRTRFFSRKKESG